MSLHHRNLYLVFFSCLACALLTPVLLPTFRLQFFIPYMVILFYNKPRVKCLWGAVLCGLIIDLLSSKTTFGMHAINFCAASWILYPQRRNFFADSLTTLPIMTFFFSLLSTLFSAGFMMTMKSSFHLTQSWVLQDLLLFPAADALFAFTVFILPQVLFGKPARRGKDYFSTTN